MVSPMSLQVMYGWRKVCLEYAKRLDPDLPFFYHTSTHQRFYEGDMPSFSLPPKKQKTRRVARRELATGNIGGRVTMAQRGAGSIRAQYHNIPVELPSPPGTGLQHRFEHSYSSH